MKNFKDFQVLILTPTFCPLAGGAETNILETSKRLVKNGLKVTIVTQKEKGFKNCQDINGIKILYCKYLDVRNNIATHLVVFISMLFKAIKSMVSHKYDVIHAHMAHYPLLIGIILRFLTKRKLIVTVHGSDLNIYGKKFPFRPIIIWALRRADKIIVVSKELGNLAGEMGVTNEKIVYIPNGVDVEFFYPKKIEKYYFDALFFGSIKRQKGLDYLVDAVKILKNDGVNVKVAIAGDGPYVQELLKKIHFSNLEDNIILLGKLGTYRLREVIWRSKIIIFPSISEGLPCALLESMACAKPIIATSVGGMKEVIRSGVNGILIPPKDPKAIANSILFLTRNDKIQFTLSVKAREDVANYYRWEIITDKIIRVYSSFAT